MRWCLAQERGPSLGSAGFGFAVYLLAGPKQSRLRFLPGCGFSLVKLSEQAATSVNDTLWTKCVYNTQR